MCESERAIATDVNCDYENVEDEGIGGEFRLKHIDTNGDAICSRPRRSTKQTLNLEALTTNSQSTKHSEI